jgi:hypothetical protein
VTAEGCPLERLVLAVLIGFAVLAPSGPAHADGVVISSTRVEGTRIHVTLRNDGATEARALTLALTTRAGGFMLGTASHPVPALGPGASREITLPLPVWAPERLDLLSVITQRGCCTTRVVLHPDDVEVEVSHLLPLPIPSPDDAAPAVGADAP